MYQLLENKSWTNSKLEAIHVESLADLEMCAVRAFSEKPFWLRLYQV